MRYPALAITASLLAVPAQAQGVPDREVNGLNAPVFTVLQRWLQMRGQAILDTEGAKELAAAITMDGTVDSAERDLLVELSQRNFYAISIGRGATPGGDQRIMLYPSAGEAKQILFLAIDPALEAAWTSQHHGWGELLANAAADRPHVKAYLTVKLGVAAAESNMANRYKPFRDLVSALYADAALAPGSDSSAARTLLHEAAQEADREAGDKLPDFLYNWVKPA